MPKFKTLKVTDVQIYPFVEGPSLGYIKGFANIVLNEQLCIRSLKIMEGENGFFIGYPNDPFYKGEDFKSLLFPITKGLRDEIENKILEKYRESIKK